MKNRQSSVLVIALAALLIASCADNSPEGRLAAAKERLAKNEHSAAIIELKNALQSNPKSAEARLLLGTTLLETGDASGAEIELRRALENGAAPADVIPSLAQAMVNLGRFKDVVSQYGNESLTPPERHAELAVSLGDARLQLGQVDEARREFDKALKLRPGYAPAMLGSARVHAVQGDLPGALKMVAAAIEATPNSVLARVIEGDLLLSSRRIDDALVSYRAALKINPRSVRANDRTILILIEQNKLDEAGKQLASLRKLAPKRPDTYFLQAYYEYRRKDIAAAREAIQRVLAVETTNVQALWLAAAIESDGKAYAQAEDYLQRALARAPNLTPARRLLVTNYLRSGRHAEAVDALKPLLRSDNNIESLALAGQAYLAAGQAAKAEPFFAKAVELKPTDERVTTGLALTHLAQGRVEEAFQGLEKAAENDPSNRAELALFAAAMRQRDYARALSAAESLEKKQPKSPVPHNMRGITLLAKRDVDAARKSFERALELDPAYFPAAANLGRLDLQQKKPDAAQKRFEAVLAKNPKSSEALLALAEIKQFQRGSADDVAALIGRAISANPQSVPARVALINFRIRSNDAARAVIAAQEAQTAIPDRAEIFEASGRAYEFSKNPQQAVATYGRWARVQPNSPAPHVRIATVQITTKDFSAAEASLRKALEIKPNDLDALQRSIALDTLRERFPQALETARRVQKQRPNEPAGFVLEGDVHATTKAWPAAITAYRNALAKGDSVQVATRLYAAMNHTNAGEAAKFAADRLAKHPKEVAFRVYLAESSLVKGDYSASSQHYKTLLQTHGDNALWLNNLAVAASRLNDPQALSYAEKAAALAPTNPAVMDTLGYMLVEKGETGRGIELLRKATDAAPQAPAIRLNLAKAYVKAGQKSAAKTELDTLAKLGSNFAGHAEVDSLLKSL